MKLLKFIASLFTKPIPPEPGTRWTNPHFWNFYRMTFEVEKADASKVLYRIYSHNGMVKQPSMISGTRWFLSEYPLQFVPHVFNDADIPE